MKSDADANHKERIAVFPGSFDPFTLGHADIVSRGLRIFDRIVICIGININKPGSKDAAQSRKAAISELYADTPEVTVECCDGLTADFVKQHGACAILRGVRSVKDFEYERDMADANRALAGVDTVVLYADPSYAWISSSLVRELQAYGRDTSDLLPHKIK